VLVQSVFKSMEWPTELRGHCPPFIAPKRNLPVGGVRDPEYPARRLDMSGKRY
jgi:hypothetical protein